ncbi:MAG: thioredoxin family protein [Proteobacteria bacterium]|nr:thioredoxin family protein [Pseudomonadota bacterium]
MAATESTMLELGVRAPDFKLLNTNPGAGAKMVSLTDYGDAKALLVMFVCNHCPYVIHLRSALVALANDYAGEGLQVVAISSNSADSHPQDGPDAMREEAQTYAFPYAYLYDETQMVAKAYKAACTPDFYLFDHEHRLAYRGRFDGSRPKNDIPVTGDDMRRAVETVLAGHTLAAEQIPSMGCNIKWAPGNEPDYF